MPDQRSGTALPFVCECRYLESKYVALMEMNVDQKYLTSSDYVHCRQRAESECPLHGRRSG